MNRLVFVLGLLVALPAQAADVLPNTLKVTDFVNATVDTTISTQHPRFGQFSGLRLRSYTTAQRDGIPARNKAAGDLVWNSTAGVAQVWDGTTWQALAAGNTYTGDVTGHLTGGVTLQLDYTGNLVPTPPPGIASLTAGIYAPPATPNPDALIYSEASSVLTSTTGWGIYSIAPHGSTTTGGVNIRTSSTDYGSSTPDTVTGVLAFVTGSGTTSSGSVRLASGDSDGDVGELRLHTGSPGEAATGGPVLIYSDSPSGTGATVGSMILSVGGESFTGNTEAIDVGGIVLSVDGSNTTGAGGYGITLQLGDLTGADSTAPPISITPGAGPSGQNDGFVDFHLKDRGILRLISDQDFVGGTGTEFGTFTLYSSLAAANVASIAVLPAFVGDNNGMTGVMIAPLSVAALGASKSRSAISIFTLGNAGDNAASATYGINIGDGSTVPSTGASLRISSRTPYAIDTTISSGPGFLRWGGAAATVHAASCGTSPSISGNNQLGTVTTGTGSPSTCQIDFTATRASNPVCLCNAASTTVTCYASTMTTTSVTFTLSTGTSSLAFVYSCAEK